MDLNSMADDVANDLILSNDTHFGPRMYDMSPEGVLYMHVYTTLKRDGGGWYIPDATYRVNISLIKDDGE